MYVLLLFFFSINRLYTNNVHKCAIIMAERKIWFFKKDIVKETYDFYTYSLIPRYTTDICKTQESTSLLNLHLIVMCTYFKIHTYHYIIFAITLANILKITLHRVRRCVRKCSSFKVWNVHCFSCQYLFA